MFYQHKHYPYHGLLFLLSLLAAFLLGRKSEKYGFTIISRGCCCDEDEDDYIMSDPSMNDPIMNNPSMNNPQ